jgi:hypothetical protein
MVQVHVGLVEPVLIIVPHFDKTYVEDLELHGHDRSSRCLSSSVPCSGNKLDHWYIFFFKMGAVALASVLIDAYGCFIKLLQSFYNAYYKSWISQSGNMNQPTENKRQNYHDILRGCNPIITRQPNWLNKSRATVSKRLHPESMIFRCSNGWR